MGAQSYDRDELNLAGFALGRPKELTGVRVPRLPNYYPAAEFLKVGSCIPAAEAVHLLALMISKGGHSSARVSLLCFSRGLLCHQTVVQESIKPKKG